MRTYALPGCALLAIAACATSEPGLPPMTAMGDEDGIYSSPSYSPDGSRIAFWRPSTEGSGTQLWVANADLSGATTLQIRLEGPFGGNPPPALWSPDGTMLAAISSNFSAADVVIVSQAGGDVVRVTTGAGIEGPLMWHPDGDRLVYFGTTAEGSYLTYITSLASGEHRRLVPGETRHHAAIPSPDGTRIAMFVYDPPRTMVLIGDSTGANFRPVADDGLEAFNFTATMPWSPDSRYLLYESRRTGTADLWIAPADGGEARQLTRDVRNDFNPSWSPDGSWIAFLSERGRQTDVWAMPADGGEEVRVTDDAQVEFQPPVWRPGTERSLALLAPTRESGVWEMNLADGAERRLTPDSVQVSWFNVSAAGDRISVVIPRGGGNEDLATVSRTSGELRTLVTGGTVVTPWWSPNDSLIVYSSDRAGTWDVWVVGSDGAAPRNLVNWPDSWEFAASWLGDGSIVFQTDRTKPWGDAWVVDPAGGEPRQVTRTGTILEVFPRGSPSGILAFEIGGTAGQFGVSLIKADGSIQKIWDRTNVNAPGLSYDGAWVAAGVEQPDGRTLGTLLSTRGQSPRVLLNAGESFSDWSRDGTRMLYTLPSNGVPDLGIISVADGTTRRLTTTPEAESGAEFTPDGNAVVFRRTKTVQRIHVANPSQLLTGAR